MVDGRFQITVDLEYTVKINGEEYVGGTWHYVNEHVDMGNILKINKITVNFMIKCCINCIYI